MSKDIFNSSIEDEHTVTENILEKYKHNPCIRFLVQLIPFGIGSAIDVGICTVLENAKKERMKTFFDELERGNIFLSRELIETEDFLHCYFITLRAIINTRRRRKIEFFARLLKASTSDQYFSSTDEFEEYIKILDELSFREINILMILDEFEQKYPISMYDNELKRVNEFWECFLNQLKLKLNLDLKVVDFLLKRLVRTGCYEVFTGQYWGDTGGKGKTTPIFKKLKEIIEAYE